MLGRKLELSIEVDCEVDSVLNVILHKLLHLNSESFLHFLCEAILFASSQHCSSLLLILLLDYRFIDFGGENCKEGIVLSNRLLLSQTLWHLPGQERILVELVVLAYFENGRGLAHNHAEVLKRDHHHPVVVDLLQVFDAHEVVVVHDGGEHCDGVFAPLGQTADARGRLQVPRDIQNETPKLGAVLAEKF